MIWWNAIFEIEKIEKLSLIARLPTHHDPPPPPNESRSNRESCPSANHEPFFDSIGPLRTSRAEQTQGDRNLHRIQLATGRRSSLHASRTMAANAAVHPSFETAAQGGRPPQRMRSATFT